MKFVLRRSLPSIGGLVGLLLAVGFAVVAFLGAPVWFPVAFAVVMLGIQYLVNPYIIQWLVPATVIAHDSSTISCDSSTRRSGPPSKCAPTETPIAA